ncbi:MAG: hypothetical protein COB60_10890 [Flavobacteriaceae bacterium]|nr:MAG: hypothetical protein COB60_10890 [Flavobacteriaceae bacterium]
MKKACTLLILLFPLISFCQISNYEVLYVERHGEVGNYLKKSAQYKYKNADSTTYYALKAYNINQLNPTKETLNIQSSIYVSVSYFLRDDLQYATVFVKEAHQRALVRNEAFYLQQTYTIIGNIKLAKGDSFNAIVAYKKALSYAKELNKPILRSIANQNLSICYAYQNKISLAKEFAKQARENYEYIDNNEDSDRTLFSNILINESQFSKNLKEGLQFLKESKDSAEHYQNTIQIASILKHKGQLLTRFNEYEKGIEFLEESRYYVKNKGLLSKELACDIEIANAYLQWGNYKKATYYLNQFLRKKTTHTSPQTMLNVNLLASTIFAKSNNYKVAQKYALKYGFEKDSILNHNVNTTFAEYGKRFESDQKEKEITLNKLKLSKEINTRNLILFASFAILFFGFRFFKKIYDKEKNKKHQAEIALKKELEFTEARTKFLGNISHEIRTPITLIVGYLNLMKENKKPTSNKKYIDRALFNCEKVISDANEVLTLIKFEKQKTQLNLIDLPLNEFIQNTFFSFENTAAYQQIKLQFESTINPTIILNFDFDKLEKILNNIISNAIKYSGPKTKISLACSIENLTLKISIKDQGMGISTEEQTKIFERFYQTNSKKSTGGLGIGLSLAKELVHFLKGEIQLKSSLKQGSIFTVLFPIETDKHTENSNKQLKKSVIPSTFINSTDLLNSNKPLILVVDDNIEMLRYLKELFTPHFNCLFAYDATEALNLAKHNTFDLVSSDVMMPGIDGFEFKSMINQIEGYEQIPFIMLSANTFSTSKIKGFNLGINDYITKPFESIELITRMHNLLKNSAVLKKSLHIEAPQGKEKSQSPTYEQQLILKISNVIESNLEDENFKIDDLAKEMGYSQRQLARILVKHTGLSPVKFILELKLKEAYKLIKSKQYSTISEVRFVVGINSGSYFTKKFKERFGLTPSNLI